MIVCNGGRSCRVCITNASSARTSPIWNITGCVLKFSVDHFSGNHDMNCRNIQYAIRLYFMKGILRQLIFIEIIHALCNP